MNFNYLKINYFKSLININIDNPGNFLVFFGSNASGKSNIFEAIEFAHLIYKVNDDALKYYDNPKEIRHYNYPNDPFYFKIGTYTEFLEVQLSKTNKSNSNNNLINKSLKQYFDNYSRIFIGKEQLVKFPYKDDSRLALDASNLESVLKRLLTNNNTKEELVEILTILIPEFRDLNVIVDDVNGQDKLLIYEKTINEPFNKRLISDGSFNLICLLVAVLQSDIPQFICIEEPENGLNPKVLKVLVEYYRNKCIENNHIIWLNTHSQSLVSELNVNEIVIVDKADGITKAKQFDNINLHGLKVDEAWLSNVFKGGIPW